jgi:hypothetical protein
MLKATSLHYGVSNEGDTMYYPLKLADESDGTKRLMELAPAIEKTLSSGDIWLDGEIM